LGGQSETPQADPPPLEELVRRARARLVLYHAREGLSGALAALAGAALAALCVGLATPVPPAISAALALLALTTAAIWGARSGLLPILRLRSDDAVALRVETAFPDLGSRFISAVQLAREIPGLAERPRFSASLARALIDDARQRAASLDLSALAPRGRWAKACGAVLVVGSGIAIVGALAPERLERALTNLAGGDSPAAGVALPEGGPSLIADLTLRYHYPEYTGLAPRVVEGSSGEITAVKGTVVQIAARAMVPIRLGELKVNEETVPLRLEGERLEGALTVLESGTYQFFITEEGGARRPAAPAMKIGVENDRAPRVRILAPGPEVVVGERGRVEVRFSADDDFGLRDLWVVFQVQGAGTREETRRLRQFEAASKMEEGAVSLSVFDLGLRPGERVGYRLRVHDNDIVSGPKKGDSGTQYLKIYSRRERHLELLEEERRVWDLLVHLLAEEIVLGEEASGSGPGSLSRAEEQARRAAARSAEVEAHFDGLLARAREDNLFDERSRATLQGVRRRVRERRAREARWLSGSLGNADRRLHELLSLMRRHVQGSEADVLLLEKLFKQQKLEALRALAQELVDSQKRLKDLLETYRKTRDPELRAAIEREMARIEEKIRELRHKLAELFDVDDEFVNLDVEKAKSLEERLSKMRQALARGDLEKAMGELERMAKELQNTLEKVDLGSKAFYESAFYKTQKQMEKVLDEVHELEQAEREVARETREVEKAARGRAAKELDVARSEAARRIQRRLEEVHREAEAAGRNLENRWNRELCEKAGARAADAARALQSGDAAEALDMARRGAQDLGQLHENISRERPWRLEPSTEAFHEAREKVRRASRGMREAVRDLEKLLPRASESLSDAERQRLGGLARRQRGIKERAGRLKRKLEEVGEQAPLFGDDAKKSLDEAHEQMGQAEAELGRSRPREALGREERAAEALGRLKDQLQQAMKPQGGERGQGEGEGDRREAASREKVRIPGAEEHRSPKEFREDLLKAMKQGAPGPYRDLVRRYYEELVR
jgi:hypothetical protein